MRRCSVRANVLFSREKECGCGLHKCEEDMKWVIRVSPLKDILFVRRCCLHGKQLCEYVLHKCEGDMECVLEKT